LRILAGRFAIVISSTSIVGILELSLVIDDAGLQKDIQRFFSQRSVTPDYYEACGSRKVLRYSLSGDPWTASEFLAALLTGPYKLPASVKLQFFFSY